MARYDQLGRDALLLTAAQQGTLQPKSFPHANEKIKPRVMKERL